MAAKEHGDLSFMVAGQDLEAQHACRAANNSFEPSPSDFCVALALPPPAFDMSIGPATTPMSSDSISLLAQRLQTLSEEGIRVNPATANPGGCPQRAGTLCGLAMMVASSPSGCPANYIAAVLRHKYRSGPNAAMMGVQQHRSLLQHLRHGCQLDV